MITIRAATHTPVNERQKKDRNIRLTANDSLVLIRNVPHGLYRVGNLAPFFLYYHQSCRCIYSMIIATWY
jgi:hypothetical protein